MSSAGRGERVGGSLDDYPTPKWALRAFLDVWVPGPGILVEPCSGSGNLIEVCREAGIKNTWMAFDVNPDRVSELNAKNLPDVFAGCVDFISLAASDRSLFSVSAVITNPPYNCADMILCNARRLYPNADIVMLMRVGFLESETRTHLHKKLGVPDVYVLPNRPSFVSKGTDSATYGWMVWPKRRRKAGKIQILKSTSLEDRKKNEHTYGTSIC